MKWCFWKKNNSLNLLYQLQETLIIQGNNNHILKFPAQPAICGGCSSQLHPEFPGG